MFECKLKIESNLKKIGPDGGLSLKDLSELIGKLSKCLEKKGVKFCISDVQHTSYTPVLSTESEEGQKEFFAIHENIFRRPLNDLSESERSYAVTLKKVLFDNGLYLNAISSDGAEIKIDRIVDFKNTSYSLITTLYAKIITLNGRNEKQPFIVVNTTNDKKYKLFVSGEDEIRFAHYYKGGFIRFRAKIHSEIDSEGQQTGRLFDYIAPDPVSFFDSLNKTKETYKSLFLNIQNSAKAINDLRNLESDE